MKGNWRVSLSALLAIVVTVLSLTGLTAAHAQPPASMVIGWGENAYGQLGNASTTDSPTAVEAQLPAGTLVTAIAAGFLHSLAATSDGGVLAWGYNDQGQLGDGTETDSPTPVEVHLLGGAHAVGVAAGFHHSLAVMSDGSVQGWGYNSFGQLGNGNNTGTTTPVSVLLPAGTRVTGVAAGYDHSLAVTSDGRVLAWGYNGDGELGDGTTNGSDRPVSVLLPAGAHVIAVAAGAHHSLAVTSDGRVLAWGQNTDGQLGDGSTANSLTPVEVPLPAGVRVTGVAGGFGHSLAVTSDGGVLAWGENANGQLGDGTTTSSLTPVEVALPAGVHVTAVAAGFAHSLALASDPRVLAWGLNANGQLGDGTTTSSDTPVTSVLTDFAQPSAVTAGGFFSLALADPATSAATVSAAPARADAGAPVTLTAAVTCSNGTPTGTVTFRDGTPAVIGSAPLVNGRAELTVSSLPPGPHKITAHYNADHACPAAGSEPVTVTIAGPPAPSPTPSPSASTHPGPAPSTLPVVPVTG